MNFKRQSHEDGDDNFSDAAFSPEENKRFRRMLRDEERARWFWSTVRIWVGYFTAAIIGIGIAAGYLRDALKGLVR
jgi:hypothetical protein